MTTQRFKIQFGCRAAVKVDPLRAAIEQQPQRLPTVDPCSQQQTLRLVGGTDEARERKVVRGSPARDPSAALPQPICDFKLGRGVFAPNDVVRVR